MNTAIACLALLVVSSPVLAKSAVGLAYDAPDGCPVQQEFVAAVAARGGDFDGAGGAGSNRVMVVAIRKESGGFTGAFQVRDDQTATNKREVHGPSCAEVVDALAVVTAIALRPEGAAAQEQAAAEASPAASPRQPRSTADHPSIPAREDDRLRGSTFTYHPAHESMEVGPGKVYLDTARTLTAYGGVFSGAAPSVLMPRFDLSLTVASFVTTPDGQQRLMGLVEHLRTSFLGPATYRSVDTKTDLHGASFEIGSCTAPYYDSAGLVLLGCLEAGVGLMNLQTTESNGTHLAPKNVLFGTAGVSFEAQYNVGSVFHVAAKVGWDASLGPWTAERADGSRIFTSSPTAYALLGVGFRY